LGVDPKMEVVPFEFVYPLDIFGNFWNPVRLGFVIPSLKSFGIYLKNWKSDGIKEKGYQGRPTAAVQPGA
jgi:hypothetical protein